MPRLSPDILRTLSQHLSETNARLVLDRAMARLKLSDHNSQRMSDADRRRLVTELERAAQLFLDPARLVRLRAAFSSGKVKPELFALEVSAEHDVSIARVQARKLCEQLGAPALVVQKVATVVSELVRNMVAYTPGGRIELMPADLPRPHIVVRAVDRGTGIPDLDVILSGRYVSKTGLGVGLIGSKRLMDRFDVETGPDGTRIEAEVSW